MTVGHEALHRDARYFLLNASQWFSGVQRLSLNKKTKKVLVLLLLMPPCAKVGYGGSGGTITDTAGF